MLKRLPGFALSLRFSLTAALLAAATSACKAPQAYGERNSIIVRVDSAVWSAYEPIFEATLEPRVFTVRPERTFEITPVFPWAPQWEQLREWQQVLVLGTTEDPLVRDLLERAGAAVEPWTSTQLESVWARGQIVTVVALPSELDPERLRAELEQVQRVIDREFVGWVRNRMFASGVNDSLRDALRARGFTLALPNVYDVATQDSFFWFRNAHPDPGTMIRSLLLTWVPEDAGGLPGAARLRAWREEIDERFYQPPQDIAPQGLRVDTVTVQERRALQMRGVWQDRSDFPAAGPFIARAVPCPEQGRIYYMDAFLYAPGEEDKYAYVIQLETLLDSFRCLAAGE